MAEYIHGEHTIHDIKYHIVWITKYRYKVLKDKIALRAKELLIQGCSARNVTIPRKHRKRPYSSVGVHTNRYRTEQIGTISERPFIKIVAIGDSICGQEDIFVLQ